MRDLEKRNFILVTELTFRRIQLIVEGPDEQTIPFDCLGSVDMAILEKQQELDAQCPIDDYDVVVTRARHLDDLKISFPEWSGWELATREICAPSS